MNDRAVGRLKDIGALLSAKNFQDLEADRVTRAAFERFLEIISEASHSTPDMPWRRIGDIGNHLRHACSSIDPGILWSLYEDGNLTRLRKVATEGIQKLQPKSGR